MGLSFEMPIPRKIKARPFANKKYFFVLNQEICGIYFVAHVDDLKRAHTK